MDWTEQQAKYGALVQPQQNTTPVAPKKAGGLTGFLTGAIKGIAHPFAEFGTAAALVPKAIYREAQNKPIQDIQKRAFGTNDSGTIAKKIISDTAQVGLTAAVPEAGAIGKNAALGAGYGASSALGEDNSNLNSVLEGGVTGGLTGGAIGVGGKILNKLTGGVESAVEKGAAKVADKTATQDATKTAMQALEEEKPYAAIGKGGREQGNMRSTLDFMKNLKMGTDPKSLDKAASLVTGDNGAVSGVMRELTQSHSTPVNVNGFMEHVQNAINENSPILGEAKVAGKGNSLYKNYMSTLQNKLFEGEGSLTGLTGADKVFGTVQDLDKQIARYSKSAPGTEGEAIADVAKQAKGFLEDKLYNDSEFNKTVKNYKLAPEDEAVLRRNVTKQGASKELADHIVGSINDAQSGQQLRSAQAPFVNASKLSSAANKAGEGVLTDIPKTASEAPGMFAGRNGRFNLLDITQAASGHPLMLANLLSNVAGGGAEKTGPGIFQRLGESVVGAGKAVEGAVPGGTGNIMNKVLTTGATTQQPQQPQPQVDQSVAPVDNTVGTSDITPEAQTPIFNSDNIQKLVLEDLAKNGGKNVSTLLSLYSAFGKPKETSAADKKAQTAAKNAEGTLNQIESSFNAAGGGKGKVGGIFSNIAGKIGANSNVATYNDTATALAASLYKALGNTGTISDNDQKLIAKLIPKTTDTDTTAKAKIAQLHDLLQQAQSNLVTQ